MVKLPVMLPEPCPICGEGVYLVSVDEWETESGKILGMTTECESEPDIDSDDWSDWFAEHFSMPYVDWVPYDMRAEKYVNQKYRMGLNDELQEINP